MNEELLEKNVYVARRSLLSFWSATFRVYDDGGRLIGRSRERDRDTASALLLTGTWFVLLFASLVRYMTTTPSAEGRLLFPGPVIWRICDDPSMS